MGPNKYNVLNHNCQDFVVFCMRALGCPESMIVKIGPTFNHQDTYNNTKNSLSGRGVFPARIFSAIDTNKAIDLTDGKVSNGTKIQIWDNKNTNNWNRIWKFIENDDGSFTIVTFHDSHFAC